jgi:hypothetical protein
LGGGPSDERLPRDRFEPIKLANVLPRSLIHFKFAEEVLKLREYESRDWDTSTEAVWRVLTDFVGHMKWKEIVPSPKTFYCPRYHNWKYDQDDDDDNNDGYYQVRWWQVEGFVALCEKNGLLCEPIYFVRDFDARMRA